MQDVEAGAELDDDLDDAEVGSSFSGLLSHSLVPLQNPSACRATLDQSMASDRILPIMHRCDAMLISSSALKQLGDILLCKLPSARQASVSGALASVQEAADQFFTASSNALADDIAVAAVDSLPSSSNQSPISKPQATDSQQELMGPRGSGQVPGHHADASSSKQQGQASKRSAFRWGF